MCLSNFKAIRQFKVPISWLRDFTRSYEKMSFRILRPGPGPGVTCWRDLRHSKLIQAGSISVLPLENTDATFRSEYMTNYTALTNGDVTSWPCFSLELTRCLQMMYDVAELFALAHLLAGGHHSDSSLPGRGSLTETGVNIRYSWTGHDMGTLSTLLAICVGNTLVTSGFL